MTVGRRGRTPLQGGRTRRRPGDPAGNPADGGRGPPAAAGHPTTARLAAPTGQDLADLRIVLSVYLVPSTGGSDGAYTAGESLFADADFSEDVIASGTPQLELDFEGAGKAADFDYAVPKCEQEFCVFSAGPFDIRGVTLAFEYTVSDGDQDVNGVAIGANAISLNGGAIKDAAGNDAVLTHAAVSDNADFKVAIGGL